MKKVMLLIGVCVLFVGIIVISRTEKTQVPIGKQSPDVAAVTVVAENLDTPWGIGFLDKQTMLVTQRKGDVRLLTNGKLDATPVVTLPVIEVQESGLLGIAVHPDFAKNHFVYLYYSYKNTGNNTINKVVRMTYHNKQLTDEKIIVDKIPGAGNHNGGRIKFGPDKLLYIATGDAENPSQAQDKNALGGKILRVTDEGKSAPENPFKNPIYSYGHRNVQGLAWNKDGYLWATEHGPSGAQSGRDELNLIIAGANYGWPVIQGSQRQTGLETARKNSETSTWAPSGAAFIGDSLFFGGLRGQTLYEGIIKQGQVTELKEHLAGEYGRIREVILGPDGMLYLTTSNKDGRGIPQSGDDKIIRVNPKKL